ncbi:MAG: hypothetical protein KKH12_05320 [Gammaproteobacteria bacterium]|nr:hypothetical protein [Gammaproteobacteria bacterium]MBU1481080.1 hypothetical protein [Gammaproteobacteria bacterium]
MDENKVVTSVCARLVAMGCKIDQQLTTKQKGIDVIAHDLVSGHKYFVEAKGSTSSRDGSARSGRAYSASQVFNRVSKGVFTCIELRAENSNRESEHVILAVPDSESFRKYLKPPILEQLKGAGIEVWFEH